MDKTANTGEWDFRMADPIDHVAVNFRSVDLSLGFVGKHVSFEHRDFNDRTPEARGAYLRLKATLLRDGMRDPLITHKGHVLIGMRRFEILRRYMFQFPCTEIMEDVSEWTRKDIKRLNALKRELYQGRELEFVG